MVTNSTGHFRCPSQVAGPYGIPIASWQRRKNLEIGKEFQESAQIFLARTRAWLTQSALRLSVPCPPQGRLQPLRFLIPIRILGLDLLLDGLDLGT
jgi:hypothetical protein